MTAPSCAASTCSPSPGDGSASWGRTASGKSTLLRAVAGRLPSRAVVTGTIEAPADLVHLGQEPPFPDGATVAEVLEATLHPLRQAVRDVEELAARLPGAEEAYAARLDWALAHDAWDADRRAEVAAHRLGLERIDPARRVGTLSGGQRTRLALATVMTTRPTCLLLDEPTNHLDDEAIDLLSGFLRDLPGVVLFASHDRVLLDDVATDLVDLDPTADTADDRGESQVRRWVERVRGSPARGPTAVGGDLGVAAGGARPAPRRHPHRRRGDRPRPGTTRQRQVHPRLQGSARRPGAGPSQEAGSPPARGRRAGAGAQAARAPPARDTADRGRSDRADRPGPRPPRGRPAAPGPARPAPPASTCWSPVPTVRASPRCWACSPGAWPPRRAPCRWQPGGWPSSPRTCPSPTRASAPRQTYRRELGDEVADIVPLRSLGLLHPRDLGRPVGLLSVGQRRRLGLAVAVAAAPDLLLLDEPTNHVSLALAGELEEALAASPGAVVVATHDRWLRRRWEGGVVPLSPASAP